MKGTNALLITLLMGFLMIEPVLADGMVVPDTDEHLNEPTQKAVITWDGSNETMMLSTAVKSEKVSNIAWIVPIQSKTDPEVSAGNISVFEDLVDYFKVERHHYPPTEGLAGKGVEVVEEKKIDVYDIAILKASSSQELLKWLEENNYKVRDDAKPVIQNYVDKEDFYFIANKINMRNKHKGTISGLKKLKNGSTSFGAVPEEKSRALIAAQMYAYLGGEIPYEWHRDLREEIQFPYGDWEEEIAISVKEATSENKSYDEVFPYNWGGYIFITEGFYSGLKSQENVSKSVIIDEVNSKFKNLNNTFEASSLRGYYEDYNDLQDGVATPLKFEFQPHYPFYPLYISSVNKGKTHIEVYVLSENKPMEDQNGVLELNDTKEVDEDLKKKLGKYLDIENAKYVTRLIYNGSLEELDADAILSEKEVPQDLQDEVKVFGIESTWILAGALVIIGLLVVTWRLKAFKE